MPLFSKFVMIYFTVVSVVAIIMTIVDKSKAKRDAWRIPEATLMTVGLFGGAIAMYVTMKTIRHKTKHKKFMIGLVSRLTDQKGLDLINHVMEGIVDEHTQFVIIGTGEPHYENMFRHYAWKYPERVSANICYSDDLAHKLYAAADAFLMPSRFEPCGLTQ